ncbi:hypothetical protein MICRO116_910014 [Micrococcus sp. 116]|nr:hypothetical protein MICRO116_910014 [Micrococcus sp. 116]
MAGGAGARVRARRAGAGQARPGVPHGRARRGPATAVGERVLGLRPCRGRVPGGEAEPGGADLRGRRHRRLTRTGTAHPRLRLRPAADATFTEWNAVEAHEAPASEDVFDLPELQELAG